MILKPWEPHHAPLLAEIPLMIPISLRIIVKVPPWSTRPYKMVITTSYPFSSLTCPLHTLSGHSALLDAPSTYQAHSLFLFFPLNVTLFTHKSKSFPLTTFTSVLRSLLFRKAYPRHGIGYSLPPSWIYSALFPP